METQKKTPYRLLDGMLDNVIVIAALVIAAAAVVEFLIRPMWEG